MYVYRENERERESDIYLCVCICIYIYIYTHTICYKRKFYHKNSGARFAQGLSKKFLGARFAQGRARNYAVRARKTIVNASSLPFSCILGPAQGRARYFSDRARKNPLKGARKAAQGGARSPRKGRRIFFNNI